jgi:hypothetical protein
MTTTATDSTPIDFDSQEHIYHQELPEHEENNQNGSLLLTLLKSIKIGSDLSKISNPITFDKGISHLERMADIMYPTDAVIGLYKNPSPKDRFLSILKIILAGQSPAPRFNILSNEKPFNPIIGEEFHCHWNHSDGSQTFYVAEQVTHHPPHTAVYLYNRANNYTAVTSLIMHSKFTGNKVTAGGKGMCQIHILLAPDGTKETYNVTFPTVNVRGLIFGKACFELGDELVVTCVQTQLEAKIQFKKGHKVNGNVSDISSKKPKHLYTLEGNMLDVINLTNLETNDKSVLIDTELFKSPVPKFVKPVSKQRDNESRKVWHQVTYHIKQKDFDNAAKYKKAIEERQRALAKQAKENHVGHLPVHFSNKSGGDSSVYKYIKHSDVFTSPEQSLEANQIEDDLD